MVDPGRMAELLVLHEGLRLRPYLDTKGNWTIGVGYNVTARGWGFMNAILGRDASMGLPWDRIAVTEHEAMAVLAADVNRVEGCILRAWPFYLRLDQVRQAAVLDMAFNLERRILGFARARTAIEARDYENAALEMLHSDWHEEVGRRAERDAEMIRTGGYWTA